MFPRTPPPTSMPEDAIRQASEHSKTLAFQRRVDNAIRMLEDALTQCENPYVAFSCGKDSGVIAHMAMKVGVSDVRMAYWPKESPYLNNYEQVLAEWKERFGLSPLLVNFERKRLDDKVAHRWDVLANARPATGAIVGLRGRGESLGRMSSVIFIHGPLFKTASGLWRICPLAYFDTIDVAAYTVKHDLPLLRTYFRDGWDGRTSARVPRKDYSIRGTTLKVLNRDYPGDFQKLYANYPEVINYV